jgi:release factor glutamine methyltransferase
VEFIQSDLFKEKKLMQEYIGKTDIVVSNPPYIPTKVIEGLSEEVRLFDPMLALDGHEDGLYFYRKITGQAKEFLKPGGFLFYEIGHDQSEAVENEMALAGYTEIVTIKDFAGLDRVVRGRLR